MVVERQVLELRLTCVCYVMLFEVFGNVTRSLVVVTRSFKNDGPTIRSSIATRDFDLHKLCKACPS